MKEKSFSAVNIQFPISQLILSGEKTVETRTYALPDKYLNQDLLMIETPGKRGKFKSRAVAVIRFELSFAYASAEQFYEDFGSHRVSRDSEWAWSSEKPKWGWKVRVIKRFEPFVVKGPRGIRFTKKINCPLC